ncbi:MAG: diphosphomevalonate decarboxylase [Oligoflexia bacterium]|nr:diphosphomevalonate decarboxylase [Oligoflexia bacterium]
MPNPTNPNPNSKDRGRFQWRAPSNIALIKYWGKKINVNVNVNTDQLPATPSISFTLENSYTEIDFSYERDESLSEFSIESMQFFFENSEQPKFQDKIYKFLKKVEGEFPFLKKYRLKIKSSNSFPHSAGIASSASSMAALALCLLSLEKVNNNSTNDEKEFLRRASEIARSFSGSAARSIYGNFVLWGESEFFPGVSSDHWAIPLSEHLKIHKNFSQMMDAVLIVDSSVKKVSSSAGHALMNEHPFKEGRYQSANKRIGQLAKVLESGDYDEFIEIVESEALTLHALMMSSSPYYLLLKPESLVLMEKIWEFRRESKIPLCFTIDAGPNIHLIYPAQYYQRVRDFIELQLAHYLDKRNWICDEMGTGPAMIIEK